jgi:hypothetical protein
VEKAAYLQRATGKRRAILGVARFPLNHRPASRDQSDECRTIGSEVPNGAMSCICWLDPGRTLPLRRIAPEANEANNELSVYALDPCFKP